MKRNGHKFNAVRTEVDGYQFASKAEAKRYVELKMLQKAGELSGLTLQPAFELSVDNADYPNNAFGRTIVIGKYVADFLYYKKGKGRDPVIEDVKGMKTDLYRWKKKHVEAQYGITITEITR